ncbi:RagB/SusD family nutrient uptake outer membrane protein [Dysgonomonas sp. 520]|uniref:RagB/SusD family nutrient uptake outer membrane protein n=1 Tax=Dysgonomonas sp. 520 TaxID=2302931 RepID=UPI0013D2ABBB|nr:RagB/SusD family nutrient uptake outer membrane protein [Dysgonomonas sp. 520]NDW09684.1 RagB/SusD family nutrient uptake outer membrane protein [Dysgonomonas sp. 520]
MKKYILLLTVVLFSFSSCDDFFDVKDSSTINPEIWDDYASATYFVNTLYGEMVITQNFAGGSTPFGLHAGYTEETVGSNKYLNGEYEVGDNMGTFTPEAYGKIRRINMVIENMNGSAMSEDNQNKILGQAYFFRAWTHWTIIQVHGGVPYVKRTINPYVDGGEKIDPPRDKTSDCIKYLCEDLDEAINRLPAKWDTEDYARITRAAAAALKGRILLHYASPMFNPSNDVSRWNDAYEANKKAKEICDADGYGFYKGELKGMFLAEGKSNPEAIFVKAYNSSLSSTYYHSWCNSVRPFVGGIGGADGGGTTANPTWNLVSAFPMSNGLAINESGSGYSQDHYWVNRDPRFYATIGYNGCDWPIPGMSAGGQSLTKIWTYVESDTEEVNYTRTGFYCRKMTDDNIAATDSKMCGTDWMEIRYTEVIMNLAEAANEFGKQDEALDLLAQVRDRAGIVKGSGSYGYGLKDSYSTLNLRELILNERLIEFAFENKRFWDMRRWLMYRNDLGNTPKLNGSKRKRIDTMMLDDRNSNIEKLIAIRGTLDITKNPSQSDSWFFFDISDYTNDRLYPIDVPEKYDFIAIPKQIIERSANIKQTKGWTADADVFDPYE